jgi:hypothetical protein
MLTPLNALSQQQADALGENIDGEVKGIAITADNNDEAVLAAIARGEYTHGMILPWPVGRNPVPVMGH